MPCTPTRITPRHTSSSRPTPASKDTASRSRSVAAMRSASRRSAPFVRSSSAARSRRSPPTRLGSGDRLASESQLRWLGPEKGVIHISMAAIVNAVWDLHARHERKPVWKLLADMTPAQIVSVHRLPLHHRRAHSRRGAGTPRTAGVDEGGARGGAGAGRLPGIHDVGRLDRLFGREDPGLVPGGGRRRLESLQGEGWRCPGR